MAKVERICEVCGNGFEVVQSVVDLGKGRFCSRPCYAKWLSESRRGSNHPGWKNNHVERECLVCGKAFLVPGAVAKKKGTGKYCSWECQYKRVGQSIRERYDIIGRARTKRVCVICGTEFERTNTAIRQGEGRTCSRECHGKYRSEYLVGEKAANWKGNATVGQCITCGKNIRVRAARRADSRDRFCSRSCFHAWYSKTFRGENHPHWRGGSKPYPPEWQWELRDEIRERDGNKCMLCGDTAGKRKLSVHHIDYIKTNLDPMNLITLCISCHTSTNFNREQWQHKLAAMMERISGNSLDNFSIAEV